MMKHEGLKTLAAIGAVLSGMAAIGGIGTGIAGLVAHEVGETATAACLIAGAIGAAGLGVMAQLETIRRIVERTDK